MKRDKAKQLPFAVYSIIDRDAAIAAVESGGAGALNEGKRWVTASNLLDDSAVGAGLPLLLADAACIRGAEWVGTIRRIEVDDNGSRVHFEGLSYIRNPIPLSALLKESDGEPLDEGYRRPYMPCMLTDEVVALAADSVDEAPPEPEPEPFGVLEAAYEIDEDPETQDLPETERQALIDARLGQGAYRASLLRIWDGRCAVTGCSVPQVLIASHAKPWSQSTPRERLDEHNGLLLAASVDRLFDQGLISFADDGRMLVIDTLSDDDLHVVGLHRDARLVKVLPQHRLYLQAHREANGFEI